MRLRLRPPCGFFLVCGLCMGCVGNWGEGFRLNFVLFTAISHALVPRAERVRAPSTTCAAHNAAPKRLLPALRSRVLRALAAVPHAAVRAKAAEHDGAVPRMQHGDATGGAQPAHDAVQSGYSALQRFRRWPQWPRWRTLQPWPELRRVQLGSSLGRSGVRCTEASADGHSACGRGRPRAVRTVRAQVQPGPHCEAPVHLCRPQAWPGAQPAVGRSVGQLQCPQADTAGPPCQWNV